MQIREIISFSRIDNINQNFLNLSISDQIIYITNELKNVNWYKSTKRLEYNTWLYYKYNNYNPELLYERNKFYIKLNKIKIRIRIQDFFFINFMNKLMKKKSIKQWLCDGYVLNDKLLVEYSINTHKKNKGYRVDYMLNISDNNYLCVEFFENEHKDVDDPEFKKEKNRIYSMIYDSDDTHKKILFFGIYWESKIFNDEYFTQFVKIIYNKMKEYKDLNNERIWCIKGINDYINNNIIAESIYDSHKDATNTVININELNKVIGFKNEHSKQLHYKEFIDNINELVNYNKINTIHNIEVTLSELNLNDSDDEQSINNTCLLTNYISDNKLSLKGFTRYLKINKSHLINVAAEESLLNFHNKITQGFVFGLNKQRNILLNLEKERIIGMYDY